MDMYSTLIVHTSTCVCVRADRNMQSVTKYCENCELEFSLGDYFSISMVKTELFSCQAVRCWFDCKFMTHFQFVSSALLLLFSSLAW